VIEVLTRALEPIRHGIATVGELPQLQAIGRGIGRLSEAGTSGYPPDVKRRLKILNLIAYLIVVSTLVYAVQHALLDYETYKPIIWINLALVGAALAVPLAHRINEVAGALLIVWSRNGLRCCRLPCTLVTARAFNCNTLSVLQRRSLYSA
jgi:hypothetical protein